MSNLNKILAGLVVLQLALFFVVRAQGGENAIAKSKPLLPGFKPETITKVQIFDAAKDGKESKAAVILTKQGDGWVVESHGGYPADSASVGTFVGKFGAMQARGPVSRNATRHDQLRVGATSYERKVVLSGAGADTTVYIGVAPKFRKTAVRVGAAVETYAVTQPSSSDASEDTTDWVDPVYLQLDAKSIVSLSVENKGGAVSLERGDDKQWKTAGSAGAVSPAAAPIDQAEVGKLVAKIEKLNLTGIVAKAAQPAHGFDKAAARITVGVAGAAGKAGAAPQREVFIIEVGVLKDGDYMARSLDKGFVVTVARETFDPFVDLTAKKLEAKPGAAPGPGGAPQLPPGMRLPPGTKLPPGFKLPPGMRRPPPRPR